MSEVVPKFNVGNPEFPFSGGYKTYSITETHAWRRTTFNNGRVAIHRAPIDLVDEAMETLWEPWNDQTPSSLAESVREEIETW